MEDQYIDWNHPEVPKWAVCCVIDNDKKDHGKVAFFDTFDVHIAKHCEYWEPINIWAGGYWVTSFSDCINAPLPPWQESKRRRPE